MTTPRRMAVACWSLLAAACYTYAPLGTVQPNSDAEVSLALSDVGRGQAGSTLGASVDRVEGKVVQVNDTAYVLHVDRVEDIRGGITTWSGETVPIPRAWVGNASTRQLSRSRTYLVASAFAAALTAFIATRTLTGSGGPTSENPGGGGGNQQ